MSVSEMLVKKALYWSADVALEQRNVLYLPLGHSRGEAIFTWMHSSGMQSRVGSPDMAHSCKSHMITPLPSKLKKEWDGIGQSWHHCTCPCYVYRKYWVWRNFWWFGGKTGTSSNSSEMWLLADFSWLLGHQLLCINNTQQLINNS